MDLPTKNYMVFNVIDFLLGAKKVKKPQRNPNQVGPMPQDSNDEQLSAKLGPAPTPIRQEQTPIKPGMGSIQSTPGGNPVDARNNMQFEDSNNNYQVQAKNPSNPQFEIEDLGTKPIGTAIEDEAPQRNLGPVDPNKKTRVSDAITKIHEEAKSSSEKLTNALTDLKNIENTVNSLGHRVDELEEARKVTDEKVNEIDSNMTKFLSLYELVNNQYNPFVEKNSPIMEKPKQIIPEQKITLDSDGNTLGDLGEYKDNAEVPTFDELRPTNSKVETKVVSVTNNDVNSTILELDTLDIEEAAGDAIPLTKLKNNTNSLVTILSWLEYLVKRIGVEETRNTLRYYTEVLRWINPEVFFDLDKYLKGMRDKSSSNPDYNLEVKDHIVSLYFISKLNEKALDPKLTKAVIQLIKQ